MDQRIVRGAIHHVVYGTVLPQEKPIARCMAAFENHPWRDRVNCNGWGRAPGSVYCPHCLDNMQLMRGQGL